MWTDWIKSWIEESLYLASKPNDRFTWNILSAMIIQHWQCSGTKQSSKFWRDYTSKTTELQSEGEATSTVAAGGLCSVPVVSITHDWRSTNIRSRLISLFFSNVLHSQPLLSDSWKVDVILYVLLLGRFTQSLCPFFTIISDKQNSKIYNLRVLWKLKGTSEMM
jgi:hypothetical protein